MRSPKAAATENFNQPNPFVDAAHWLTIAGLVLVPLVFSTAVLNIFAAPKFAVLLTVSSALAPLLAWMLFNGSERSKEFRRALMTRPVLLVSAYVFVILVATIAGISPRAMFVGSISNRMGLLSYICFFVVFVSLMALTSNSERRFRQVLWAMSLTGLAVSTYAFLQFFGRDPFLTSEVYTFESSGGLLLRVQSTLGHSNYLGNFLLYVTPLAVGLAVASSGHARRAGLATAALSSVAILFSGTRGAWLGLAAASVVFVWMSKSGKIFGPETRVWRWVGVIAIVLVVSLAIVMLNPGSRTIVQRAKSLIQDTTGSGRTILWHDSMKMIPAIALTGCGPEGFRSAFLPYKSIQLSREAPGINNESPHNSIIDATVSFGLGGGILYVAIIASSILMLIRARGMTPNRESRVIIIAILSSLVGVVVHNIFIFDQISTGLYFFAIVALAYTASERAELSPIEHESAVASVQSERTRYSPKESSRISKDKAGDEEPKEKRPSTHWIAGVAAVVTGVVLFLIGAWFSIDTLQAENEIGNAIKSADAGRFSEVLDFGNRAISHLDPTGDYHFSYARALALYGDSVASSKIDSKMNPSASQNPSRMEAFNTALAQAESSLAHTVTPNSSYVLMAYLALQLKRDDLLFHYSKQGVLLDPNFANAHWLMAEAYLMRNDSASAREEAKLAMLLNPNSYEASSLLKRTRDDLNVSGTLDALMSNTKALVSKGKLSLAERRLRQALRKSGGKCAECHKALAWVFEAQEKNREAIAELEIYLSESPESARQDGTPAWIERLRTAKSKQE
jgi:O-antigen ligase/tetratricopeptide (TPR) repeat protein